MWLFGWFPQNPVCLVKHRSCCGLLQCCCLGTKIDIIFRTLSEICSFLSDFLSFLDSSFQRNIENWHSCLFFFGIIERLSRRSDLWPCCPVSAPGGEPFNSAIRCSDILEQPRFPGVFFPSTSRNRSGKRWKRKQFRQKKNGCGSLPPDGSNLRIHWS